MKHASPNILSAADKLDPTIAANLRRVATADTGSSTPKGANRPAGQVDMARKIGPHRTTSIPDTRAPSTSGPAKQPHSWPPPTKFTPQSGIAKKAAIGSMPSRVGPPK
jgi:hypothetical protein